MRFTGQFTGIKFDLAAYKKRLETLLNKKLQEAANSWLLGVTGRVPVWSGMSQASLLALTELINGTLVITPRVASRIPEGNALGTAEKKDFIITITTSVPHYNVQEVRNVGISKSAPWRSLIAGAAAYKAFVKDIKLPAPKLIPVKMKL